MDKSTLSSEKIETINPIENEKSSLFSWFFSSKKETKQNQELTPDEIAIMEKRRIKNELFMKEKKMKDEIKEKDKIKKELIINSLFDFIRESYKNFIARESLLSEDYIFKINENDNYEITIGCPSSSNENVYFYVYDENREFKNLKFDLPEDIKKISKLISLQFDYTKSNRKEIKVSFSV